MNTKKCTKCGRSLPLTEFGKHKLGINGLNYWCKKCQRENTKHWENTPRGIYAVIKRRLVYQRKHPKRRGKPKPLTISKEDFIEWYNKEIKICAYCSIPEEKLLAWNDSHNNKVQRLTIDCIDNNIGYTKDNLVLACLRCNGIKSDIFSHETMREIGQKYIRPIWEKEVTKVNKDE